MAKFRVETQRDAATGLIFATLYYPEDARVPLARTEAVHASDEDAENAVLEQFRRSLPE